MQVYCPNCGQANDTAPGVRVTCASCTAVFDAPGEPYVPQPSVAEAPQSVSAPVRPPAAPARTWQPPIVGGSAAQLEGTQPVTNTLAIVSLVAGIVCCIPGVSPLAAIVTGAIALSQINQNPGTQKGKGLAIAGIVLGCLTALFNILGLIGNLAQAVNSSP